MPAPIVLRTLTPEVKKVDNPPAGQPVIATKAELRDGSRPGGSDPVDPPPSGGLTDAQWVTRLESASQNFTTGTSDPTFDPRTDISYVGAFRVERFVANGGDSFQKIAMCYNPPNGSNGPNGSVFVGGLKHIAEIQIPTLSTATDHTALPNATVLQTWQDMFTRAPIRPVEGTSNTEWCGWLKIINGKLYSGWHAYYTFDENNSNVLIIDNPSDLANSSLQGFLDVQGADKIARYCAEVPAEHQAALGGTHFNGVGSDISILSRLSYGLSVIGWSPGAIGALDTTAPTTDKVFYPQTNPVPGFNPDVTTLNAHYTAAAPTLAGESIAEYLKRTEGAADRPASFDVWPLPDQLRTYDHIMGNYMTYCGFAFIPPGSDSICFLGSVGAMRYGMGYKQASIQGDRGTGGWSLLSTGDDDNVFWTMNINDIAGAANTYDVAFSDWGIFQDNRWMYPYSDGVDNRPSVLAESGGKIMSGDFDPSTGRLYLFQPGVAENAFSTQYVISVYQVGAA